MTNEKSTPSTLHTTDTRLDGAFILPKRFVRHLQLFSDLDVRTYVLLLSELLPSRSGEISKRLVADTFGITEMLARRTLLRLMAFGLIRMSPDSDPDILRIELHSDSTSGGSIHTPQTENDWAARIAEAVGDKEHMPAYRYIVDTVAPEIIRRAMTETLAVPSERIRKSRSALFFALIRKYAATPTNLGD